jgi:dolichyl-phosphate beta-glucosyltransferase
MERTCHKAHAAAQEAKLERSAPTPELSIVLPCHDEAVRLPPTLARYLAGFPPDPAAVEFIVVDIGSSDGTAAVAERFAARDPRVRVLRTPSRGKGFGVRAGMLAARGRLVAFTDGDGSYGPEQLRQVMEALQEAPVAIGVRSAGTASGLRRSLASSAFNAAVRLAVGLPIRDTQCGPKG